MRSWARRSILVLLCAVLSACTLARFGYELLPWYAAWQVDRHLNLDEAQRAALNQRLESLHGWHRQTQLSRYAGALAEARRELSGHVDAALIARLRARTFEFWPAVASELAPGLAELGVSLRPAQIDRLERRLEEGVEELRRKYLLVDERRRIEARAERWQERAESMFGDLSSVQSRELRRLAERHPSDEAAWIEERAARGRELVVMLRRMARERPSPVQAQAWALAYLDQLWLSQDPERRRRIEANNANGDRLVAMTVQSASNAQRRHMLGRLHDFEHDFLRLSGASNPARQP